MTKKRNPQEFTIDEAQTATLIMTEGTMYCRKAIEKTRHMRPAPRISIRMCDREALEPASRVFQLPIGKHKYKRITCQPELFPPDGKGQWAITIEGKHAIQIMQRLTPLLTTYTKQRWGKLIEKCK